MNPDKPWMCPGTVKFCQSHLNRTMRVLEFGSGRSTAWFAQLVGHITSIESRAYWHGIVTERLKSQGITNVDYRLIPLEHSEEEAEHIACDPAPAYVRVTEEFADGSLDLVVVDGHYRDCCIRKAAAKLKPGGYMLVDDINFWPSTDYLPVPPTWKVVDDSSNGLKRCIIWQANASELRT